MRVELSPARLLWRWLIVLLSLGCLSCSGGSAHNSVQGKVLYKEQPIAGVLVTFHPVGDDEVTTLRPSGLTKEDGTFTLTTGQKEGAPAGEFVVTFTCQEEVKTKAKKTLSTEMGTFETQDRFQGAYADRSTSKFKVEIKNGANQLEPFRLK